MRTGEALARTEPVGRISEVRPPPSGTARALPPSARDTVTAVGTTDAVTSAALAGLFG